MQPRASAVSFAILEADDRRSRARMLEIYRRSIPAHEQKPAAEVDAMVDDPRYEVMVGRAAGEVVAFTAIVRAADRSFALLEYLAVDAPWRGLGLGALALAEGFARVRVDDPALPVLIEVDAATEDAPDRPLRRARAAFYRRAGCRALAGLAYLLPIPGVVAPAMDLLVHAPAITAISRATLEGWLCALYREVYAQERGDPRIDRMLAPLAESLALTVEW